MTPTVVILLLCAMMILLVVTVLVALLILKALRDVVSFADRVNDRQQRALRDVLDRFMALDFSTFKAAQAGENLYGEFLEPDEDVERVFTADEAAEHYQSERRGGFFRRYKTTGSTDVDDVPEDPTELEEFAHLREGRFIGTEGFERDEDELVDVTEIRERMEAGT